jgi:hypothetical protein
MVDSTLSGAALEEALKDGSLETAMASDDAVTVVGMVKASENPGQIAIATGGCDTWIETPVELIETAELIGRRGCRDHAHNLARITFTEPEGDQARVFASLLTRSRASANADPRALLAQLGAQASARGKGGLVGPALPWTTTSLARANTGDGDTEGPTLWEKDPCMWLLSTALLCILMPETCPAIFDGDRRLGPDDYLELMNFIGCKLGR